MTNKKQELSKDISLLFETSWEVCNKIGGIYTVLSTKAKNLCKLLNDNVIFIGPDVWSESSPSPYFEEDSSLLKGASAALAGKLPHGITLRTGRWNVPGNPAVVLIKFEGVYPVLNDYFFRMWQRFGVDSLQAYGDYPEGCAFGIASALTIAALTDHLGVDRRATVSHFDEWTTAMGLLLSEIETPEIATVFTTHATSIGRSICGNGKPLYDYFTGYNGDIMAKELNMEAKHSLEKTAAHRADCFTTVSKVTASECRQLLDIYPGEVTPNGFEPNFVPAPKAYKADREAARSRMLRIASALTGREFADDKTFIVATSGRNEYRNKGLDLFIDSLNNLRCHYPENTDKQLLAFIMVPAWVKEPQKSLLTSLDGKSMTGPEINFITHRLNNEDSDSIFNHLRRLNVNKNEDKVTFVYLPCYLDGNDGVLDIPYYKMVPGLDATVFPSYYEPWGYTPLESIAFGVPTISTDKAGFGEWVTETCDNNFRACGVKIVERTDSNYSEACDRIAYELAYLLQAGKTETTSIRKAAKNLAAKANWSEFIKYYSQTYAIALSRRDQRVAAESEPEAEAK